MKIFGNLLVCCNSDNNKLYKNSDILIKKEKSEINNLGTYILSEKNSQINHYLIKSFNNITQMKYLELSNSKNDEEDKKSAEFPKLVTNNEEKKVNQKLSLNKLDFKDSILSIADIPFLDNKENNQQNFSKLLLTGDLFFGKELIITNTGIINGKRNKKDGIAFFGLNNSKDISGQLNNDFLINFGNDSQEIGNIDTETGRVFQIIFSKKNQEYSLYFINPYLYLYYKINNYVYFLPQKDYFLFIGKIFLLINVVKKGDEQTIFIQVDNTIENGENKEEMNKKYSFVPNKGIIKIGRANCDININEKCISKVHGIIEFSKNNEQFYYKDMNSTNGTTLLIKKDDSLKIKGEMNFKLEDVAFKIQEIP